MNCKLYGIEGISVNGSTQGIVSEARFDSGYST